MLTYPGRGCPPSVGIEEAAMRLTRRLAILVTVLSLLSVSSAATAADTGTGSITGTVTTDGFGFMQVSLRTVGGGLVADTIADPFDGTYAFPTVPAGSYKLRFSFSFRIGTITQWAHRKTSFDTADTFEVVAGQATVVDETMFLPGAIEVRATDSVTGEPVDNYCAHMREANLLENCGAVDGVLRIDRLGPDMYPVFLRPTDGLHFRQVIEGVSVSVEQTTRIDVSLVPAAAIRTTVVDRTTGDPVLVTCAAALPLRLGAIGDTTCETFVNFSGEDGRVTIGELASGQYTLLAVPTDDAHGIQWVGRHGGVGSQYAALSVEAIAGQLSTVAPIRLDPPATISGVIRDAATNAPLPVFGCASILPIWQSQFGPLGTETCTDFDGSYALRRLGPYHWPVHFWHRLDVDNDYARVWSGNATDRRTAELVRAKVDRPGIANATLRLEAGGLTGTISQANGDRQLDSTDFRLFNDRTGDLVKERTVFGGEYTLQGLAGQSVRIWFAAFPAPGAWHGGTSEANATPVRIRDGRLTTLNLVAPAPT
jgi:hypothetical protein